MSPNHDIPIVVSVIVLTYNQQGTIAQTLDSILSQKTDFPFEIIIGEDCSSDNTLSICRQYQKVHPDIIRLIHNETNKGVVINYFDCLLLARGKYIADCAGDDFWIDSLKLQKQVNVMQSDPKISLVHTGWIKYLDAENRFETSDNNEDRKRFIQPIMPKGELVKPILRRDVPVIVHLCTALYRKDIFLTELKKDRELFYDPRWTCEDIQISVIMAASGDIAYIPDETLAYRVYPGSVSTGTTFEKLFRFYFGTLQLNRYIQKKYSIKERDMGTYYDVVIPYLFAQLFRSGKEEHVENFRMTIKDIPYHRKWKTRLYNTIMDFPTIWKKALAIIKSD